MQFKFVAAAVLLFALANPAQAQSDPGLCKIIASPASTAATQMQVLINAMDDLGVIAETSEQFEGDELASLQALEEQRVKAKAALVEFVTQLEDTAYVMQVCARQ